MVAEEFVQSMLLLVSSTLFLSYISNIFYTKTRIPDIVWLLGLGYLLGPVLGFFDSNSIRMFEQIFPMLILVTVSMFSFDTGISVDINVVMKTVIISFFLNFFCWKHRTSIVTNGFNTTSSFGGSSMKICYC